jgi:small conductance mechanosensitive channel
MDFSVDYLVELSEAWLPVVIQYGAQVTLALLTFLIGWWLINKLVGKVGTVLNDNRQPGLGKLDQVIDTEIH